MSLSRLLVVFSVVGLIAGGCASTAKVEKFTFPIDPSTTLLAVDVENTRGTVEVRTRAKDGAAHVEATLDAFTTASSPSAADQHTKTRVDVTLEQAEGRGVLRVRALNPEATDDIAVHLVIRVPQCDGMRIVNRGGNVVAVGTKGSADITNRDGAIELRSDYPQTGDMRLLVTNGSVFLQVPPGSTGVLDLETLKGQSILRDFSGDTNMLVASREALMTTLNDGTNPVVVRTNDGDIRMWVMEDPEKLTRIFKIPPPNPRAYMFKEGSKRYTRNLPDDEPRHKSGTRANPGG